MSARPVVRVLRRKARFGEWRTARLAQPIDPLDTFHLARAASLLHGFEGIDARGALTPAQARDVCAWADQPHPKPLPLWRRLLSRSHA